MRTEGTGGRGRRLRKPMKTAAGSIRKSKRGPVRVRKRGRGRSEKNR